MGFQRTVSDQSIWVFQRDAAHIIIPVFIDHMTIAAKSKSDIDQIKGELRRHFKLRDLGPTSWLLGVEIKRNRKERTITLSQHQYILDLLQRFNLTDCNTVTIPVFISALLCHLRHQKKPMQCAQFLISRLWAH